MSIVTFAKQSVTPDICPNIGIFPHEIVLLVDQSRHLGTQVIEPFQFSPRSPGCNECAKGSQ